VPLGRAQTRETLRPYLVEEVLELDHAIGHGDADDIRGELSDLLLNLAFQLVIAEERGEFTADRVAEELEAKMRRRHPHLFDLGNAEPWERIKRRERRGRTLDGLVPTLPPLLRAYRLQERAAGVGFDWPTCRGRWPRCARSWSRWSRSWPSVLIERKTSGRSTPTRPRATPSDRLIDEIGDLLFTVVNLARKAGVEPGVALDRANRKFRERFEQVETLAEARGIDLADAGLSVWTPCGTK
jgi:MazG family protein